MNKEQYIRDLLSSARQHHGNRRDHHHEDILLHTEVKDFDELLLKLIGEEMGFLATYSADKKYIWLQHYEEMLDEIYANLINETK